MVRIKIDQYSEGRIVGCKGLSATNQVIDWKQVAADMFKSADAQEYSAASMDNVLKLHKVPQSELSNGRSIAPFGNWQETFIKMYGS